MPAVQENFLIPSLTVSAVPGARGCALSKPTERGSGTAPTIFAGLSKKEATR